MTTTPDHPDNADQSAPVLQPFPADKFNEWLNLQSELATLKDREMTLRKEIIAHYFSEEYQDPDAEGSATFKFTDGASLKAQFKQNRTVDIAVLGALRPKLAEVGVNVDQYVKWKPELELSLYRKLSPEALVIFDSAITARPGSPSLEFIVPKVKK